MPHAEALSRPASPSHTRPASPSGEGTSSTGSSRHAGTVSPAGAAVDELENDPDSVLARCSWCTRSTRHSVQTRNYIRRSVYACNECKKPTLECKICFDGPVFVGEKGMAKETSTWSHDRCVRCLGEVDCWPDWAEAERQAAKLKQLNQNVIVVNTRNSGDEDGPRAGDMGTIVEVLEDEFRVEWLSSGRRVKYGSGMSTLPDGHLEKFLWRREPRCLELLTEEQHSTWQRRLEAYNARLSSLVVGAAVSWTRHDDDVPKGTVGIIVQASDTPDGPRRLVRFNCKQVRVEAQQLELADANLLPGDQDLERPLLQTSDKTQDGVPCCRPLRNCMRKVAECCGDTCNAASTCVCMPCTLLYRCWQNLHTIMLFTLVSLLALEGVWFIVDADCQLLSRPDDATTTSGDENDVAQSLRLGLGLLLTLLLGLCASRHSCYVYRPAPIRTENSKTRKLRQQLKSVSESKQLEEAVFESPALHVSDAEWDRQKNDIEARHSKAQKTKLTGIRGEFDRELKKLREAKRRDESARENAEALAPYICAATVLVILAELVAWCSFMCHRDEESWLCGVVGIAKDTGWVILGTVGVLGIIALLGFCLHFWWNISEIIDEPSDVWKVWLGLSLLLVVEFVWFIVDKDCELLASIVAFDGDTDNSDDGLVVEDNLAQYLRLALVILTTTAHSVTLASLLDRRASSCCGMTVVLMIAVEIFVWCNFMCHRDVDSWTCVATSVGTSFGWPVLCYLLITGCVVLSNAIGAASDHVDEVGVPAHHKPLAILYFIGQEPWGVVEVGLENLTSCCESIGGFLRFHVGHLALAVAIAFFVTQHFEGEQWQCVHQVSHDTGNATSMVYTSDDGAAAKVLSSMKWMLAGDFMLIWLLDGFSLADKLLEKIFDAVGLSDHFSKLSNGKKILLGEVDDIPHDERLPAIVGACFNGCIFPFVFIYIYIEAMVAVLGEAGDQCREATGPPAGDIAEFTYIAKFILWGHVPSFVLTCAVAVGLV